MKKNFFSAACLIAGAAVMFSSCSNDDDVINGGNGNGNDPVQTISMQVANTGDNFIGTRATDRPLYSSEAKQNIEKVKVVIYKLDGITANSSAEDKKNAIYGDNKTIAAVKTFEDWMNGGVSSVYNNTNGHGRQASWTLSTSDLIKDEGFYVAYAIGYNSTNYDYNTAGSWKSFLELAKGGQTTFPVSVNANADEVKEIFAGMSDIFEVTKKEQAVEGGNVESYHFNTSITLHRQVAGAIGYFTNIPTKGNADHATATGSKLRLVAAAKNTKAVFAEFNSAYKGKPGAETDVAYVVNGYGPATANAKFYSTAENNAADDAFTVYEIDLADWFTNANMDTNNDGLLNELDEDWTTPASMTDVKVKEGSVLAGKFMMPFELVADKATFQLQMLDEQGNIIRYWNIRLPKGTTTNDSQIGKKVTVVSENGAATEAATVENNVNYSIVRNHLYTIGARDMGDNPENPGTDPDKPQDLNDETLILKVNDNWEMIHHMEVD